MIRPIPEWDKCSICLEILDGKPLDGTHDGLVVLSNRCYHVFHKVCIETHLREGKRNCPNCQLKHFSVCEIILNPEHTRQYEKWRADPEHYSYEQAFHEEHRQSAEEARIPAEHILRPRELRGLDQRRTLTREEISRFHMEMSAVVDALDENSTSEQLEKARKEVIEARGMILNSLSERNANQFAQLRALEQEFRKIRGEQEANARLLDHAALLSRYDRKVSALDGKIRAKEAELDKLPFDRKRSELKRELLGFCRRLTAFSEEFRISGELEERSIEESRELLELVDAELDEFIASQPEHITKILEEEPPPSNDSPVSWQLVAAIGVIFSFVIGIAIHFRDCLYRRFWSDRAITQQEEI